MSGESKHTEEPAAAAAAPHTPTDRERSYALRLRTIKNKKKEEALPGYVRSYYPHLGMFRQKGYGGDDDEDGRVIVDLISVDGNTRKSAWYKGTIIQTPDHTRGDKNYKVRMDRLPKGEWQGDKRVFVKRTGRWGRDPYWLSRNVIVVDSSRMRKIGKKKFYGDDERDRNKAALNIALASKDKKRPEGASRFKGLEGAQHLEQRVLEYLGGRRKTRKKRKKRKTRRKSKKRRRKTKKRKSKKRRR